MTQFKIEMGIEKEKIVNLFITACEGGSNYWCQELTPHGKGDAYEAMLEGFTVIDGESGKTHKVNKTDIKEAVKLFPTKAPRQFGDFLSDNDDAETGDVFLQLCVFKDIIYG